MIARRTHPLMAGLEGRFDGHAHVFRADLPMTTPRRYTPDYDAELSNYAALLRANGLDGGLLVQPSFLGTDNSFLLAALDAAPSDLTFRGVVMLDPGATIEEIHALTKTGITGLRLNLVDGGVQEFDIDLWDGLLRRIDADGWHVELHCEGALLPPLLKALLARCATVAIDHFGLPDPSAPLDCPGHRAIVRAPPERVVIKTSAPYRVFPGVDSDMAAKHCNALYRNLFDHLGPSQLIWGSDWPWTRYERRHVYLRCLEWSREWAYESASN